MYIYEIPTNRTKSFFLLWSNAQTLSNDSNYYYYYYNLLHLYVDNYNFRFVVSHFDNLFHYFYYMDDMNVAIDVHIDEAEAFDHHVNNTMMTMVEEHYYNHY